MDCITVNDLFGRYFVKCASLLSLIFFLSVASPSFANSPLLVKNINPGNGGVTIGNNQVITDDGTVFFFLLPHDTPVQGLYKTDGTAAGTTLVKELDLRFGERIYNPVALGNKIVFIYDHPAPQGQSTGALGWEIWVSDGTASGTHVLVDLMPGSLSGVSVLTTTVNMAGFNGYAYFSARTPGTNYELWRTDGTAANTMLFKQIGPGGSSTSRPREFFEYSGRLYFGAAPSGSGNPDLWATDGTVQGTVQINQAPFPDHINPDYFTIFNGELYFRGFGPNGVGQELIKYSATTDQMTLVKDVRTGSQGSSLQILLATDSLLYFSARIPNPGEGRELWISDGTDAGTTLLKDINPGSADGISANNQEIIADIKSTVVFAANDGATGFELWKTDGTTNGTSLLKEIRVGAGSGIDTSSGFRFINFEDAVYFSAFDASPAGRELWRTDGTHARVVRDFNPGTQASSPYRMRNYGDFFLLQATASSQSPVGNVGKELFKMVPVPKKILKNNQWMQISLPCNGEDTRTVGDIFSDESLGAYGTDWALSKFDAAAGVYEPPALADDLIQNSAYWIIQISGSDKTIDMPAMCDDSPTLTTANLAECPSSLRGCYEMPLVTQPGAIQWQMLGNVFEENFLLGNAIVVTDSGVCGDIDGCTLAEANSENIFHNNLLSYNGAFYSRANATSVLPPWEGLWAATMENADGLNPKLLLPLY